jgi:hypothetical protein
MALLPGGPLKSWFISAAGQFLSSRYASDLFATMFAGPKGEKTNLTPEQRIEEERQEALRQQFPERYKPKQKQDEGGGAGASGLMGLLDDVAPPIFRGLTTAGRVAWPVVKALRP